ncbi:MAG: DUF1330 domain-containing protein [Steroidobacteraceae bacterium]
MSAYVIVLVESITDPAALKEYRRLGGPTLQQFNAKPRVLNGAFAVLEGKPLQGAVVLEFDTMEQAKAWYTSPAYQEAVKHRFKAATCQAVLVQGV